MKRAGKWILILAGAIIVVLLLRSFLFTSYVIPSSGMENTLYKGDRIIINKWSYGLRVPCMSLFGYHRWLEKPVKPRDIVIFNNPADISEPVTDKRAVFINRCIGIPGDTLKLDSKFNVSSWNKSGPDRKQLYSYPKDKEGIMLELLFKLNIADESAISFNDSIFLRTFSRYEYYLLEQELGSSIWIHQFIEPETDDVRPLLVPGKGITVEINPWNAILYRNTLVLHEGIQADVNDGKLLIDGKEVKTYTFTKDYYWVASDNVLNISDSRLFGFVPHDHVIGKMAFTWYRSKN